MEGVTEVPFQFIYDSSTGKYGYKDGADTFRPFSDGSGGSEPVLLWTNPNPGSAYSSDSNVIDINTYYRYIIVEAKMRASGDDKIVTIQIDREKSDATVSNGTSSTLIYTVVYIPCIIDYSSAMQSNFVRGMRILKDTSTTVISFTSTSRQISGSSTSNQYAIPLRVWGCESVVPSEFPIANLKGNTCRITLGPRSYSSSGYRYPIKAYYNGELVYNNATMSDSNGKVTLYTESEGTNVADGAYNLEFYRNNYYSSGSKMQVCVILNGYAIIDVTKAWADGVTIDTGTVTIN